MRIIDNLNGKVQNFENFRRWHLWVCRQSYKHLVERRGSNQENEEEVLLLGGVHGSERNKVFAEVKPRANREAERSNSRKRRPLLRLRVHGVEYLPTNEGPQFSFPRKPSKINHVPDDVRTCLHAQTRLFPSRYEARKLTRQRGFRQNCRLRSCQRN